MMKRMLINTTQQEKLRVTPIDGRHLYDLDIESPGHEQKKANIYKDKIAHIESSLEAAFVNYGAKRRGSLPLKEIAREYFPANYNTHSRPNAKDVLREGQEVIVQINKEERGNENAALTTFINLTGSYLVLMSDNPRAGGVSHRVEGGDRTELKEALASLEFPDGMGLIARTADIGKSAEALQWDLNFRLKRWEAIQKATESRPVPLLIHQGSNVTTRAFRNYLCQDIDEILIDNPEVLELVRQHIATLGRPDFSNRVKLYTSEILLFSHYQIESQIESASQREMRLPSGKSIVTDGIGALTAVDVNSAHATRGGNIEETASGTSLGAADEIAHRLRLRGLSGLIVTDFIDMTPVRHQRAMGNRLREAVHQSRARIQIGRISRFDLLEMSRQHLSPSLGGSSHHVCPHCSGTGTVRDNESLSLSILCLIGEEMLKENAKEVHTIIPVPITSYLLNEKRATVSVIGSRQGGIRVIIVPSDEMQTPHYSVLHIHKGEETSTLSYLLPKLHEEEMALPGGEEPAERRRPGQPALTAFVMPDAPPAPMLKESVTTPAVATAPVAAAAPAQPRLPSRFFSALKNIFSGTEEAKPVEVPIEKKAEEKSERQQEHHKPRSNNRHDRSDRSDRHDSRDNRNNRDNRDNRDTRADNAEDREPCELRKENRRNRHEKQPQSVEARDARQTVGDNVDKTRSRDEQQPRRGRSRHCNGDKRQAQQKAKAQTRGKPEVQEVKQEERIQILPRRKPRQLSQKVRIESAVAEQTVEIAPKTVAVEVATPRSEPVETKLPAVVENVMEHDENGGSRGASGMPHRSRRSPHHLRVGDQRCHRYRDERYPTQSPMSLTVAYVSPGMTSGKVWIRYPVVHPQGRQPEEVPVRDASAIEAIEAVATPVAMVETVTTAPVTVGPTTMEPVTTEPVVIGPVVTAEPVIANAPEIVEPAAIESVPIETPAIEVPQAIAPMTIDAEPATVEPEVVETTPVVETPMETVALARETVVEAPVTEATPTAPAEPVKAEAPISKPVAVAGDRHATTPMTRAPAPDYVPEAPRHSIWVCPPFAFEGKGAADGHNTAHKAIIEPAHPQPVE